MKRAPARPWLDQLVERSLVHDGMVVHLAHKVPWYVDLEATKEERTAVLRVHGHPRPVLECSDGVLRAPSEASTRLFNRFKPGTSRSSTSGNEHWGTMQESFAVWMWRVLVREKEGLEAPVKRDWTYDECVMALHLLVHRPPGNKGASERDIQRLATVLWRTRGSVGLKVGNLVAARTEGARGRDHGGALDTAVVDAWWDRPDDLAKRFEELVQRWFGAPWDQVDIHPLVRRGGPRKADLEHWQERDDERLDAAMERSRSHGRRNKPKRSTGRDSQGQAAFSAGVLACYQKAVGLRDMKCPGCRKDNRKANGKPLLEAHHLVPFAQDTNFDHRVGAPLCPTCHALADCGHPRVKRRLFASLLQVHPTVAENLRGLREEGTLDEARWQGLIEQGVPLEPWA